MAEDIVLTKSPYFTKVLKKNNFHQKESKSILIKNGQVFFDQLHFVSGLPSHHFVLAVGELWE